MIMPARLRRTAAISAAGILIVTGAGIAPGDPAPEPLGYTCEFPVGTQQVGVHITATVPERGTPGKPIQPDQVAVTLALPPGLLAGAASVTGTVNLAVSVTQNENSVEANWSDLVVPATPVPAEGELVVTATGAVPAVTVAEPGNVTIVAGRLGLELAPRTAEGGSADPASLSVSCVLNPGQDATIALVAVPRSGAPSTTRVPSRPTNGSATPNRPGSPITIEPVPESAAPETGVNAEIPPECRDIPPFGAPIIGCAYVTGFATVQKLGGSILVEPALASIATGAVRVIVPGRPGVPPVLGQNNAGELAIPDGKLPPLTGSFLAFGFVPITATMEMSTIEIPATDPPPPTPPLPPWRAVHLRIIGETQGSGTPCQPGQEPGTAPGTTCTKFFVKSIARVDARVYDVKVNGVPLDVGPNCRTETPLELTVIGRTPEFVRIIDGGPLRGIVDIPPFTGCGVTEDLDPLLTGQVSGPNNPVRLIQGGLCDPVNQRFSHCDPLAVPPNPPPTGSQ